MREGQVDGLVKSDPRRGLWNGQLGRGGLSRR